MAKWGRFLLFVVFIAMVGGLFVWKNAKTSEGTVGVQGPGENLPRMIQVSSPTCPPCLMMVPTLNKLKKDYRSKVDIEVIDISGNSEAVEKYNIRATPTQIFFDFSGEEIYRHEGWMSKEEIVSVFEEMGVQ